MAQPLPAGFSPALIEQFTRAGYWGNKSLADYVHENALRHPDKPAFIQGEQHLSWRQYDQQSTEMALALIEAGVEQGDHVAVYIPDWPVVHVLYTAIAKLGALVVGIGPRSGEREVEHICRVSQASAIITTDVFRNVEYIPMVSRLRASLPSLRHHFIINGRVAQDAVSLDAMAELVRAKQVSPEILKGRGVGPNDVFMINSTSGTTGLPKCVMHTQNRWMQFKRMAGKHAHITPDDIFMSLLPTPFGFGLWTAHIVPTTFGATTVTLERFEPELALEAIEREKVTVLCAVSTEFVMMLNSPAFDKYDLSSLRAMFTGGEMVPYPRAMEFENRTGCAVLQFFGSNEVGGMSGTSMDDPQEKRLRTAGRIIPESNVKLFTDQGEEIIERGAVGQPGCFSPSMGPGYYNDPEANSKLFRPDGYILIGDLATIDAQGYLSVVGRVADIIIRGGANISAVKVEEEVAQHPAVAMAAVVGMPDPTFGEKICAYVTLKPDQTLTLPELASFLEKRGNAKYTFPERLEILTELPISAGGKVAKGQLREDIKQKLAITAR